MRKNLLVTIIIILIVNFVSAQSTRFGIYAGPVASTMFEKTGGKKHMHDYVMGATIGILLDVPMQKHGSFQPGLNYIGKNSRNNFTDAGGKNVKTRTLLTYLELPINVLFKYPWGSKTKFTFGGGVSAAIALDGIMRSSASTSADKDLSFGDAVTDDFGKYDFGINALAGYETDYGFFLTLNYSHGINRLYVGGDPEDKLFNRYFALRAGFLIGKK